MKKIGIITFHAPYNYGSSLQNYALQQVLIELGYEPETINFRSEFQKEWYDDFRPLFKRTDKKRFILNIIYSPFKKALLARVDKFEYFLNHNLKVSKEVVTESEIRTLPIYDGYIVGSDQCWNINARDFDWSYFMDFVPAAIPKISYAVSMGPHPEDVIKANSSVLSRIKLSLNSYTAISVREEKTANVLNSILGGIKNLRVDLDPTLLLTRKDWEKHIATKPIVDGKYIYLYNPYFLPCVYDAAEVLSKMTGLKIVVSVVNPKTIIRTSQKRYIRLLNTGPWEFLNLVKNAEYVVGRSFHLLVFSILFRKKFFAIEGMGDSRLQNLLTLCGLESCATKNGNFQEVMRNHDSVNFDNAFKQLALESLKAKEFLKVKLG